MDVIYTSDNTNTRFSSNRNPHIRKCIDGSVTGCGKCVGYCNYRGHPGYLTKELRRQHNCVKKSCRYYESKEKPVRSTSPFAILVALI